MLVFKVTFLLINAWNYFFPFSKKFRLEVTRYYYFKILKLRAKFNVFSTSVPIDVIVPLHPKDFKYLKHTLDSVIKFSVNPVQKIYIVSKQDSLVQKFCVENDFYFINEDELDFLPKKQAINYFFAEKDRSGWLFQQFIKLSVDKISESRFTLVIDADTILTKRQKFVSGRTMYLNCSDEFHFPYYRVTKRILGIENTFPISFVSHYMIFDSIILHEMKNKIAKQHNSVWHDIILEKMDRNNISGFSEFELWGNYLVFNYCHRIKLSYWENKTLTEIPKDFSLDCSDYSKFKSISSHNYN